MLSFAVFGWIFLPLVLAAFAGVAAFLIREHLLDVRWYAAISRAGGLAYQSFVVAGKVISDKSALAAAAISGAQYLQDQMAKQIAKRGVTAAGLQQIVSAELGKLFAADPSVSVSNTSSVMAIAAPGREATATVSDVPPSKGDVAKITSMVLAITFLLNVC